MGISLSKTTIALIWLFCAWFLQAQPAANWTQKAPATSPPARHAHTMAFDVARGQVVLFGGSSSPAFCGNTCVPLGDTWVWDGSNWSQKSPATAPPARAYAAMAYDSALNQVVLFGGEANNKILNDTWVWDGSTWSLKSPATSPPGRSFGAMAFDSARNEVLLEGGYGGSGVSNISDTWAWNGSTWTKRTPATAPPASDGHAMAFDAARAQVVLLGGGTSAGFLGDTWIWDGSNWSRNSQTGPPGRHAHTMTFDAGSGQVLLFGGETATTLLNDTWTWDGSSWTKKSPTASPSARVFPAMAYDAARGQVVLFGGTDAARRTLGETWVWDSGAGGGPVINALVSASAFGGFSTIAPGTWVEIYGSNLSATTREWGGGDFNGNTAPSSLDGVQVNIGGQKAFVRFIAANPGQINAQIPSGIGTGPMNVTVTNGSRTSAAYAVTVNAAQPGLLAPAAFKIGSSQYVVALLADSVTYVLPAGAIAGVASRPVRPGETIVFYGIGFGSVTPDIPAGQIAAQANQLSQPLQILFGDTPAQLAYYGLAPGYVGLYQFNVVVPAVPDNILTPLTFRLGGSAGTQTLYIPVQR